MYKQQPNTARPETSQHSGFNYSYRSGGIHAKMPGNATPQTVKDKITVAIPEGTNLNDFDFNNLPTGQAGPASGNRQEGDAGDAREGAQENAQGNKQGRCSLNLKMVLETQSLLHQRVACDIQFSQPILEQLGNAVIFPHTINVIQGQQGVHKSRVAEIICSALLKRHDCGNELLGFKRTNFDATRTVVYVDTERNLTEQLPYALQSIQVKAGYTKEDVPANFEYISLLQVRRCDRFDTLTEYLNYLRQSNSQPLFIVLDVSTDCINDFNSTDKSLELIDLMNVLVNNHDASFLCLIHENPRSDKARGHFGTELMNKATTAMQVGFEKDAANNDTELVRAKYLKCRSTARHTPFYFKYSNQANGLVLADDADVTNAVNNRMRKAGVEDMIEHIEMYLGDGVAMSRNELIDRFCNDFKAAPRTIITRMKDLLENNIQFTNNDGVICGLFKETVGKQVFYSLKPFYSM